MKTKVVDLLLAMSLCGFWGCASPKPTDTAAPGTQSAVDQNREQRPAQSSATAAKPAKAPAYLPKAKRSDDVAVQPETVAKNDAPKTVAKNDTPKIAAENETTEDETTERKPTEGKPTDMKVANALDRNPYFSSILKPLLPPSTNVMDAATGFKNQRQFIAAVHLSKNLSIPFDQIKTRMTGEHRMSLNDCLRDLRSEMTKNLAKGEVKKAEQQAKDDETRAKDEAKKAAAQDKVATNGKP
jgi:hypothetical protein